jgi:hypothetical protein
MQEQGTTFGFLRRGRGCPVKPCPEEERREQGFSRETTPWTGKSIKDTKKYFKRKFFMG